VFINEEAHGVLILMPLKGAAYFARKDRILSRRQCRFGTGGHELLQSLLPHYNTSVFKSEILETSEILESNK